MHAQTAFPPPTECLGTRLAKLLVKIVDDHLHLVVDDHLHLVQFSESPVGETFMDSGLEAGGELKREVGLWRVDG